MGRFAAIAVLAVALLAVCLRDQRPASATSSNDSYLSGGRHTGTSYWSDLYQDADLVALATAKESLRQALAELTSPYYDSAFSAGLFEVSTPAMNSDGFYALPDAERGLYRVKLWKGKMQTAYLPREGFEEAYAIRDEVAWIMNREAELRSYQR